MKIAVLGCGLVGKTIAEDLSQDYSVIVVDPNEKQFDKIANKENITCLKASALDMQTLKPTLEDVDVVCGAVPGKFGYQVLEELIKLKKNVVDISFMPEDFLALSEMAKKNGVTAIADMGVAPGMSHYLVGRGIHLLDSTQKAIIYVGGIPKNPQPPFQFKIVFSPEDVLEEYTRPARYIKDGKTVTVDALSGIEHITFSGVGELEAFFTDGLRSLLTTLDVPELIEKTMRYPGHAAQMKLLRDIGFFDKEKKMLGGQEISPIKITSDLLFPLLEMKPEQGDRDLTVMRVTVSGKKAGEDKNYCWDLVDGYDELQHRHSMARTTGFPCTVVTRALLKGMISEKGVLAPEMLSKDDNLYTYIMDELKKREVCFSFSE